MFTARGLRLRCAGTQHTVKIPLQSQIVYTYKRRMSHAAPIATTSHSVLQLLRQSLDRGRWSPGAPLRQEEIAAEYGVSRVPVREALFQLQAEGMVQVVPNKGVYVRGFSAEELAELYHLRRLVEGDLLASAVPLHDAASLNRAETIQAALDHATSVGDWLAGDREFHEALYAPANRRESLAIVRRLRQLVDRFAFAKLKPASRAQDWHEEHHAILRAVRRRNGDRAVKLLVEHLHATEALALAALRSA